MARKLKKGPDMKKDRSHVPIINLDLEEEFTKDSNKFLRELLQIFIKETPSIQQEINKAFALKQTQRINDLIHKLYGSCVYCGLDRLKESLVDLKESVDRKDYAKDNLDNFNKEVENTITQAKRF